MGKHLHIHLGAGPAIVTLSKKSPARARDALPMPTSYEELVAHLLEYIEQHGSTSDEEVGHPFHGNQYTDVPGQGKEDPPKGPKPTKAKATVAKHAVHELLSSGHAFTIAELKEATGHGNEKTLAEAHALVEKESAKW